VSGSGRGWNRANSTTSRTEAFSDGVFAVAITLLVLDLKVPQAGDLSANQRLLAVLLKEWPAYLGYALSFITILIMWINHHNIFKCLERTDHLLLILNGLLLMGITVVPFSTALLAEYLGRRDENTAMVAYSATFLVIAVLFNLLWHHASSGEELLSKSVDPRFVKAFTRQYRPGPALYLLTFVLAFFYVPASLAISILLAVFFMLPISVNRSIMNTD